MIHSSLRGVMRRRLHTGAWLAAVCAAVLVLMVSSPLLAQTAAPPSATPSAVRSVAPSVRSTGTGSPAVRSNTIVAGDDSHASTTAPATIAPPITNRVPLSADMCVRV